MESLFGSEDFDGLLKRKWCVLNCLFKLLVEIIEDDLILVVEWVVDKNYDVVIGIICY